MNNSTAWAGGISYETAHKLATEGQPVEPEALEIRDSLTTSVETIREQAFAWDVAGDAVDVGAFMSGEPECMLTTQEQEVQAKKTVNIVYYFDASGSVPAEYLRMQGIAMMALVDAIQNTGQYVINFWFCNSTTPFFGAKAKGAILAKLIDQAHPYDPQALSFAISHPAMLRHICFQYYLQLSHEEGGQWINHNGTGLGFPCECRSFPPELELDMDATFTGEAWLLGKKDISQIRNKESAMEWVQKQLNKLIK